MFCNDQVNPLTWIQWSCISLAEDQIEGKMPQEASGSEDSGSRGLAERHQGWNPASGDVSWFQTSGCHWLQKISNQVLKLTITMMLVCPITFDPLKRMVHI